MARLVLKKRIILIILAVALLSACQPTPEKPAVVGKNIDLVETVVSANSEENKEELVSDKQIIQDQIATMGGHMKMVMNPNPQVTINVDANIISPGFDKYPLVRVKPSNLSKEQFEKFIRYIAGGEQLYYQTFDKETGNTFSKEEITAALLKIKGYLTNKDLLESTRNGWDEMIGMMEDSYDTALNKADERPYDGHLTGLELAEGESSSTYNSITELKCYLGKDTAALFSLWQSFDGNETQITFHNTGFGTGFYNTFEPYEGIDAPKVDMTYTEAKAMAEDLVRTIDGEDSNLALYESSIGYEIGSLADYTKETSPQCYVFHFARSYNGVKVKHIGYLFGSDENVDYSKTVSPESEMIIIDSDGIKEAYWSNYTQYLEKVTEDAPLIDFDSIRQIFEQYCKDKFTWAPNDEAIVGGAPPATLNVKRVELNLMVIPEKDNLDNYITIPAWDFIADMVYDKDAMTQEGLPAEGQKDVSIVTINAVNGSIISREQGY